MGTCPECGYAGSDCPDCAVGHAIVRERTRVHHEQITAHAAGRRETLREVLDKWLALGNLLAEDIRFITEFEKWLRTQLDKDGDNSETRIDRK